MELKLVINDQKTGKSYTKTIPQNPLISKKIGDQVDGSILGLKDFKLQITGGSDKSGFPMIKNINTSSRKRVFSAKATGFKIKRKGQKYRKTVFGNTINEDISQVNIKVLNHGKEKLEELCPKQEKNK